MVDVTKIEAECFKKCTGCGKIKLFIRLPKGRHHNMALDGDHKFWHGNKCYKCYGVYKGKKAKEYYRKKVLENANTQTS